MKKRLHKKEFAGILCLFAVIFYMAGCNDKIEEDKILTETTENQYNDSIDISGKKVWTRNGNTTKISQVYQSYAGTHNIEAYFFLPDPDPELSKKAAIGFGNLINGVLDFTIDPEKLTEDNLLEWDYLKAFFSSESGVGAWNNVEVNIEIKGNLMLLDAYTSGGIIDGMIDRQKIIGDRTSLSCETILYFYINEDCTIVGNSSSGYRYGQSYYRAGNELYLQLKKGWNLVTRTEKYSTNISGYAVISMEIKPIKNPQDYKWVIEPGFRL